MCSGLHPPHTHTNESGLGEVAFICNLAKGEEGKKKTKHILIAVRTQKVK